MIQFQNLKDNLFNQEYENKIIKILVDELNFFTTQEINTLLNCATVDIGWNDQKPELLYFEISFFEKPFYSLIRKINNYNNKSFNCQTQIKFIVNFEKILSFNLIYWLIDEFLSEQFTNNNYYLEFNYDSLIIEDNKIVFQVVSPKLFNDFQFLYYETKKYLNFLLNDKYFIDYNELRYEEPVEQITPQQEAKQFNFVDKIEKSKIDVYQIFDIEEKKIGRSKYQVYKITNFKNFFNCKLGKLITSNPVLMHELKVGNWIEPQISSNVDDKELSIYDCWLNNFKPAPIPKEFDFQDTNLKKFNHLCLHTKMSTLDGLFNYEDYAQLAAKFGQKALAVSDLNSVQSYPDIKKAADKYKIKPIYGVELELLNDFVEIVSDPQFNNQNIKNAVYCVFDIETTGLNGLIDDVIEIAVAKYQNNILIEKYQRFVKTKQTIKPHIEQLTRINNEILDKEGIEPLAALKEFIEFTKNSILVAHNGISFDLQFLNAKLKQFNLSTIQCPLIDTLQLSRIIFSDEKRHSLGNLARRLNIDYDEKIAHRADKDVEVLADVFFKLFNNFSELKIDLDKDISQFNDLLQSEKLGTKQFGHNVIIYAKNQKGIRDIYELISLAHTQYLSDRPTLFWSVLNKFRQNLIVVNALFNSNLWNSVMMDNEINFASQIKNYDYVLIAPVSNYLHEINRNQFSKSQCELAITKLYEWTLKNHKKPIANVQVKFLYPQNSLQYSVLVHTKGLGGIPHKLFSYSDSNDVFPDYKIHPTQELIKSFEFLNLSEKALNDFCFENNYDLVDQIQENLEPLKKNLHPVIMPEANKLLRETVEKNFYQKYGNNPPEFLVQRLEKELNAIIKHNFAVIYWVSHLLVKKSLNEGYLVGSRGSVGSSFVAYLIDVTEVNPLPPHYLCANCFFVETAFDFSESGFDLPTKKCPKCNHDLSGDGQNIPFETFMGFDADKIPDIDLNFSGEYQSKAHNFIKELFGEDYCFRAGTISKIADKTAFGMVKKYEEGLMQKFSQGRIDWLKDKVTDIKRTTGQHPGGIIVVPKGMSIYDFSPVNFPADDEQSDWKTTHLNYKSLHDALLKFDVLGHEDPTILKILYDHTKLNPKDIPHSDVNVLKLFSTCSVLGLKPSDILGETTGAIGLPEFGTQFVRRMLQDIDPKTFADLVRISGLSHGIDVWRNNADQLIKKHNLTLKEVITCRDEIMIYLMNKKIDSLKAFNIMERVRKGNQIDPKDVPLLKEHQVPDWYINSANLIKYMFPKAHAAAYVLVAWRVAYYKYYYPVEYYATYFSIRSDNFDVETLQTNDVNLIRQKYNDISSRSKSKNYLERLSVKAKEINLLTIYEVAIEMLCRGVKFAKIDLNKSLATNFIPLKESKEILIPFVSIDGLGITKAEQLEKARQESPFKSKKDLLERAKVNKTILSKLEILGIIEELEDKNQISLFDVN